MGGSGPRGPAHLSERSECQFERGSPGQPGPTCLGHNRTRSPNCNSTVSVEGRWEKIFSLSEFNGAQNQSDLTFEGAQWSMTRSVIG